MQKNINASSFNISNADTQRFRRIVIDVMSEACRVDTDAESGGIGTLGEKALHAILKHYLDSDPSHHEQKYKGFYADVRNEEGFFEIQTRAFERLTRKLDAFLCESVTTVVYPIARHRRLSWIDPKTHELSSKRKSPRIGRPCEAALELYRIRRYLSHPNFRLRVILLDCDEYKKRTRGGHSAERCERIPYALVEDLSFAMPSDYAAFLPKGLSEPFTSLDLAKALRTSRETAGTLLLLLHDLGVVRRIGRKGRAYLYRLGEESNRDASNA